MPALTRAHTHMHVPALLARALRTCARRTEPYLGPAVESLARHALSSRQEAYLERARALLLGGGSGGGPGGGWEAVVAGQALQLDQQYYARLAMGGLQVKGGRDGSPGVGAGRGQGRSKAVWQCTWLLGVHRRMRGKRQLATRACVYVLSLVELCCRHPRRP